MHADDTLLDTGGERPRTHTNADNKLTIKGDRAEQQRVCVCVRRAQTCAPVCPTQQGERELMGARDTRGALEMEGVGGGLTFLLTSACLSRVPYVECACWCGAFGRMMVAGWGRRKPHYLVSKRT